MTKIYRVEDDEGRGPYIGKAQKYLEGLADDSHPMAWEDKGLSRYVYPVIFGGYTYAGKVLKWANDDALRYGFADPAQLLNWFDDKTREKLDKHGFKAAVYEAPDAILGHTQALFNSATATKVTVLKLTEIDVPNPNQLELFKEAA